jgi:hypothetical protein
VAIAEQLLAAVDGQRGVEAADRLCEACVVLLDIDAAAISLIFDRESRPALLVAKSGQRSNQGRRARARRTASSTSRSATAFSLMFSFWLIRVSRSNASSVLAPVRLRMMPIA